MPDKVTPEQISEQQSKSKFLGIKLSSAKQKPKKKVLMSVGNLPFANFLPERVLQTKSDAFIRRRLFLVSVATLSAAFLAFVGANAVSFSGSLILSNAELRLSAVKAEQAKYTVIRDLESEIRFQEANKVIATATQVDIEALIRKLTQQLPEGATYNSVQISAFSGNTENSTGLTEPYSVEILISMELEDYPSLQKFLDRLPLLPAFYDSKLSSVSDTTTGISATLTVFFTPELYSRLYIEPAILGDEVPPSVLDTEPLVPKVTPPAPTPSPSPTSPRPTPIPTPTPTEEVEG